MTENDLDEDSCNSFRDSLEDYFGIEGGYRRQGSIRHRLIDILFITICAVISGANNLKAVANYAARKENWLLEALNLTEGVPSYTTFWIVFALLDPQVLEKSFISWIKSKFKLQQEDVINLDGKAQRGTVKKGKPHSFVHIVSAWAAKNHLTPG
ncbi:MAG: ISAs1 family transposase [Parachlamydiaceae bacterium]|nr:ISAs1 family transposase [Parachlamydiaceae bacterium]